MGDIRLLMSHEDKSVKKVWTDLGYGLDKSLCQPEFEEFLKTVNPDIKKAELIYIIEQIDMKGNGKISLEELEHELKKNDEFDPNNPLMDISNFQQ